MGDQRIGQGCRFAEAPQHHQTSIGVAADFAQIHRHILEVSGKARRLIGTGGLSTAVDDQGFPPGLHAGVALFIRPALVEGKSFSGASIERVPLGLGVHQVHFPCDGGVGRSQLAKRFTRRIVSEDAEARALPLMAGGVPDL